MTKPLVAALVLLALCYQTNAVLSPLPQFALSPPTYSARCTTQATWIVDESGSGNFTSLYTVKASMVKPGDLIYLRGV
jgi:hypothetical protein